MVREGPLPDGTWLDVNSWPERIWNEAAGAGTPCLPAPPPPPPLATRVVNIARDPYQVYIGRPGPWGNPFVIGRDGDRATVIAKHAAWVVRQPELMACLGELRGRVLGCHCKPEPCHGDTLAALADGRPPPEFSPPAPYARPDSPHPMVHDVLALERKYGAPQPSQSPQQPSQPLPGPSEPLLYAWQYAEQAHMLTGDGDLAFVQDLGHAGDYVARRRGLPWRAGAWPESLWQDVSGAMAQRCAEKGDTDLDELELDAVADGFLPEPEYRPGAKPSPAQFMAHYDDGSPGNENSFWSYPPPPEDTQAYVDWERMADDGGREYGPWVNASYESDCDGCGARIQAGDAIRADGRGGWLCAICGDEDAQPYETRDAGWGEGQPPWDGDDINHSAWDPGWPPMSSEDM